MLEDAGVLLAVTLSKALHHPVNLLRLPRQPETPQKLPVDIELLPAQPQQTQIIAAIINMKTNTNLIRVNSTVYTPLSKIFSYGGLIKTFTFTQEASNVFWRFF
jgi:hypothetical protein